jgi:hypothetical protein
MRKGLAAKLALFLPLAALVAVGNYLVDPGNLFGPEEREAQVARALAAGQTVPVGFRFDELRFQQLLAKERARRPDLLVLGSSRSMVVSKEAFPSLEVVNASVSSASLEDVIALFELFEEHGLRPRILWLSVDPWALSGGLRNPSVSLDAELRAGLRRLGRAAGVEYGAVPAGIGRRWRWLRLASPAYFQASLTTYLSRPRVTERAVARGTADPSGGEPLETRGLLHPDGSREWSPLMESRTTEQIAAAVVAEVARAPAYELAPPDPDRLRLLRAFLEDLGRRGVRVVLWLPPYHPFAYSRLVAEDRARGLERAQAAVRALGRALRLPVLGAYDSGASGAAPADFIDRHHMRRGAANRLVARQLANAGIDLSGR